MSPIEYVGHGKPTGWCRLCTAKGKLSWDHVPPQGSVEIEPVEIDRVTSAFVSAQKLKKPPISQNGLKFRTLCSSCNSRLGTHCDPALSDLSLSISRCLTIPLVVPRRLHFRLRPTAIIRSVLGHLVAANTSDHRSGFDQVAFDLLCDLDAPIPEDICVSHWVFPYRSAVALRGAAMPTIRGRFDSYSVFSILKFFPVGFVVSDTPVYDDTTPLSSWRNLKSGDFADVPVQFDCVHHERWPEAPEDGNIVMLGHQGTESVIAKPRNPRR